MLRPKPRVLARASALLLLLPCALGAACVAESTAARAPAAPVLSVAVVHARLLAALSRPGHVYHATTSSAGMQGWHTWSSVSEAWFDAPGRRARIASATAFGMAAVQKRGVSIYDGPRWYQTQEEGPTRLRQAPVCRGSDEAFLSVILGCRAFGERSHTVALPGQSYDGRAAIALVTKGVAAAAGERRAFTETLYLDATSWLPFAAEVEGTLAAHGSQVELRTATRIDGAFLPSDGLAVGTFDPADIGYLPPDPEAALRSAGQPALTWLGTGVAGGGRRPALHLERSFVPGHAARGLLGYSALLEYGDPARPFSPAALTVRQWRGGVAPPPWPAWWDTACAVRTRARLPAGEVVTYIVPLAAAPAWAAGCGLRPGAPAAVVEGAAGLVVIEAAPGPWASPRALRDAVAALRTYE
jgi:hypothetical protein